MAAEVRITISQQGTGSAAKDAAKDVDNLGKAAKDSGKGFSALKEIGIGALRELGAAATNAALGGLKALGGAVMEGISDARENAKIQAQTAAVIKSMGDAAGVSAEHVADFASSLSDAAGQSLFGDDQIQQSTNLLLTFDKIKGETLDVATALTVDLAQALGGKPKDQAMMLGRALQDPIKGITALGKAGLTFSEEQKDMIRALVETGDVAGAQNIILAELQKQVGGSAAAAAAADGGWAQFNGRLGEAKEAIATAILPLLNTLVGFLNDSIMPAVEAAATAFSAWLADPAIQAGAQQLITVLTTGWQTIQPILATVVGLIGELAAAFMDAGPFSLEFAESIGMISPALGGMFSVAAQVMPQFRDLIEGILVEVGAFWFEHGQEMIAQAQATWTTIQTTIQALVAPIVAIVQALLAQIMAFWQAHGQEIMAFIAFVWGEINTIIQIAMQLIQATIVPVLQFLAGFISSHSAEIQLIFTVMWTTIKAIITAALAIVKGILQTALALIKGDWQGAWNAIKTMAETVWNSIKTIFTVNLAIINALWTSAWEKIKAFFQGIMDSVVGWVVQTFEGIKNAIVSSAGKLRSAAGGVADAIVSGITSGIANGASAIISAAKNAAMDALNAAKAALGIGSPSKLFAEQIGLPMAQGMAVGLAGAAPLVAGAGAYAAQAAYAGAAETHNNQRSMSLTQNYYGVPAAPAMDFASANSLAGV